MKNQKDLPVRQAGQVILILVLVMTVALAIGISVIQRSLSDVSTSTKVEQSSRAFSAAEAGIEKALKNDNSPVNFAENYSSATVTGTELIPAVPSFGTPQAPLEYPLLAKEETAHVWLADPNAGLPNCTNFDVCYQRSTLDVYWGDPTALSDKAALELTLVYYNGSQYLARKYYYDQVLSRSSNNFTQVNCLGVDTLSSGVTYQCKKTVTFPTSTGLMLLRARLLYNSTSQPFAVQATGVCPASPCQGYYIPPQVKKLTATGISGQAKRKVQLFKIDKVVPPYFDYAIFSAGDINK